MKVSRHDDQAILSIRDAAERAALKAAVKEALADPYGLPHEEVDTWLDKLAKGDLKAEKPESRRL